MSSKYQAKKATIAGKQRSKRVPASGCADAKVEIIPTRTALAQPPAIKATIDARPMLEGVNHSLRLLPVLTGERVRLTNAVSSKAWGRLADEVWRRTWPRVALSPEWIGVAVDSGDTWATIEYHHPVMVWEHTDAPLLRVTFPLWAVSVLPESIEVAGGPYTPPLSNDLYGGGEKRFRLRRMRRLMID